MNIAPRAEGRYELSGSVDFAGAAKARADVEKLIDERDGVLVLGLGGLTEGSSLMVALMMGWVRYARRADRNVEYVDVPPKLQHLLEFTGLDTVLPIGKGE
jgi:anti-anti-sigma regulatory factor